MSAVVSGGVTPALERSRPQGGAAEGPCLLDKDYRV